MKKVLLIVVDACSARVLVSAMRAGRLPNLLDLAQAGSLNPACTAVFPSLTPAATASLITGRYPREHGIAGAYWFDLAREEVVYQGDDIRVIVNEGIGTFFHDFLVGLNHQRLQSETVFQLVERAGLRAGCLNYFVFHGDVRHRLHVPLLLSVLPGVPASEDVYGPSLLYFGDLIATPLAASGEQPSGPGGPLHRFGVNDDATADLLIQVVQAGALPDFTLAYFPDNDLRSHEAGPDAAGAVLEHLDARLGELWAAFGGLDRMLDEVCVVLTGDHAQSDVQAGHDVATIRLDQVLAGHAVAEAGKPWQRDEHLVVCPNMRAAQIYLREPTQAHLIGVATQLLTDTRVDQAMWRAGITGDGERGYHVVTGHRGTLHFWPGADGPQTAIDEHGCTWSWEGNLSVVDGRVSAEEGLAFAAYPNAFERIAGALECEQAGHLWVTARPGHEFRLPRTRTHPGGGSHGSLHVLDSTVPLLVAGAPEGIEAPSHPRTVDVAPLCLSLLGLTPPRPLGASHVSPAVRT